MATYANMTDVRALIPLVKIDGASKPSEDQVTDFLVLCNGEIDSALSSRGVAVPVASPSWFLTDLKTVEATGAAARTLMAMFPSAAGPTANNQAQILWQDYRRRLDQFRAGNGLPSSTPDAQAVTAPRSYMVDIGGYGEDEATDDWGDQARTRPSMTRNKVF